MQLENAYPPMLVTLSPIVTSSILLVEAEKYVGTNPFAVEPTSGVLMTSLVIAGQFENALLPMLVTLLGMSTCPWASGSIAHPAKTRVSCVASKRIIPYITTIAQVLPIHMFISYFQ